MVKHERSLRKSRNRIGKITEPCGTPEFTGYKLELQHELSAYIDRKTDNNNNNFGTNTRNRARPRTYSSCGARKPEQT